MSRSRSTSSRTDIIYTWHVYCSTSIVLFCLGLFVCVCDMYVNVFFILVNQKIMSPVFHLVSARKEETRSTLRFNLLQFLFLFVTVRLCDATYYKLIHIVAGAPCRVTLYITGTSLYLTCGLGAGGSPRLEPPLPSAYPEN